MADRTNATGPAGILRPDELARHSTLARVPASAALAHWVEHHWVLTWDLPPHTAYLSSILPHPAGNLSVERGHPREGVGDDRLVVTGVVTTRFDVRLAERGWVLGVRFRPGGLAAMLGVDARQLTDVVRPARTMLPSGVADALDGIEAGTAADEAASRADRALCSLPVETAADRRYDTVLTLVTDMQADRSLLRVADLAERHGLSARQIERLFARYVGVGPKWVLARYRMHDVVTDLDAGHVGSLADLAARYGWYDQAHFGRNFARLIGSTPREYRDRPTPG